MAHPFNEHRAHKVEKRRIPERTKGYAHGGAVHADEAADKKLIKRTVKKSAMKMDGDKPKHRMDRRARGGKVKKRDTGGSATDRAGNTGDQHFTQQELNDLMNKMGQPSNMQMEGEKRGGRVHRARGGRTKSKGKGTVVNVINTPGHAMGGAPGMMPPAGMPPRPPMPAAPMPPQGMPPGMPPGGAMPPGMPPRPGMMPPPGAMPIHAKGGRVFRAKGGAVKDGPAWKEGLRNGTQVQHDDGKKDGKDIGRGKVITYKRGGAVPAGRLVSFWAGGSVKKRASGGKVESPEGVAPATKMPGGGGGAKARLFKEKRAERDYAKA